MKAFLLRGIPDVLMRRFKAACAARGRTMREVLVSFMEEFVRDGS